MKLLYQWWSVFSWQTHPDGKQDPFCGNRCAGWITSSWHTFSSELTFSACPSNLTLSQGDFGEFLSTFLPHKQRSQSLLLLCPGYELQSADPVRIYLMKMQMRCIYCRKNGTAPWQEDWRYFYNNDLIIFLTTLDLPMHMLRDIYIYICMVDFKRKTKSGCLKVVVAKFVLNVMRL